MGKKEAIIIGAGPAGLTAALELLQKTDVKPVIFEMSGDLGGISKTVNYKGNRMDIGGHRFFSKSKRVMQWWLNIFPLQGSPAGGTRLTGDSLASGAADGPDPDVVDGVMLVRTRLSRILFERRFFDYPLTLNLRTISNLGWRRTAAMGLSYAGAKLHPSREQRSLEDFLIDRFGKVLYETFFKDYNGYGFYEKDDDPVYNSVELKEYGEEEKAYDLLTKLWQDYPECIDALVHIGSMYFYSELFLHRSYNCYKAAVEIAERGMPEDIDGIFLWICHKNRPYL